MIENILGSKVKVKIIRKMLLSENREVNFEDLTRSLNLSFGTVHPALKEMTNTRIVTVRKIGKSKLYKINKTHVLFKELKMLFKAEVENFVKIAIKFAKKVNKKNIKNIILFGSVARAESSIKSDIDILIIYKINEQDIKENVNREVQKFLDLYDVEIVPVYLSHKESIKRRNKFDRFLMNILNEGKVLYGDIRWLEK